MKKKKIFPGLIIICILILLNSCSEDEKTEESPVTIITVTASDFAITIDENPVLGQVLGMVQASTNQGSLTFTIINQLPDGALAVGNQTGELSVADPSIFDFETNQIINAVVTVENGSVIKNAAITITLNDLLEDCVHFADPNFRYVLINEPVVDTNGDGYGDEDVDTNNDNQIQCDEAAAVLRLDLHDLSINSLEGIEAFTSLEILDCHVNDLVSLDLSQNTALRDLDCSSNELTFLNLSKNGSLTELNCRANRLASLNLSANNALIYIDCGINELTTLELGQNNALRTLFCFNNQLTSLDISQNTALAFFYCTDNQLTSLDISQNTFMDTLDCDDNQLSMLDLSQNDLLIDLSANRNQLISLNLSNNIYLRELSVGSNLLTTLDVSQNTNLIELYFGSNEITSIDLSENIVLEELNCWLNQISSLDISNNIDLIRLNCYSNQLTSLDVSNHSLLRDLVCSQNQLSELNISNGNNTILTHLEAANNSNLTCIQIDDENYTPSCNNTGVSWCKDPWASYSESCP